MSSMSSKLDEEADQQRLVDPALKSSCRSPVDYLDLHNCNSTSSDLISKLSMEPSCNVWLDCFEPTPSDDKVYQRLSTDGESTMDCLETDGFVCVDVALESGKDPCREMKTVPKRQIHLKRCGSKEQQLSTGTDVAAKDAPLRQLSFPATIRELSYHTEDAGDGKQRLLKSHSLDETASKTEMASSLIKSVLFKKMQYENTFQLQDIQKGDIELSKVKNMHTDSSISREMAKVSNTNLTCRSHWNHSIFSEEFLPRAEQTPQAASKKQLGSNSFFAERLKLWEKPNPGEEQKQPEQLGSQPCGEIPNASSESAHNASADVPSTQAEIANKVNECSGRPENSKQRSTMNGCVTKIPKITDKLCTAKENTSTASKLSFLPGQKIEKAVSFLPFLTESSLLNAQWRDSESRDMTERVGKMETTGKNKVKAPTHKVRDLRKVVKNTYSTHFNNSGTKERGCFLQRQEDKCTVGAKLSDVSRSVSKGKEPSVFNKQMENSLGKGGHSVSLLLKAKGLEKDKTTKTLKSPLTTLASALAPSAGLQIARKPATTLPQGGHTNALPPIQTDASSAHQKPSLRQMVQRQPISWDSACPVEDQPAKCSSSESKAVSGTSLPLQAAIPGAAPWQPSGPQAFMLLSRPESDGEDAIVGTLNPEDAVSPMAKQNPGRVLLDPQTGSFFYVKVPPQPQCKMLFDPETGQYIKVQISQPTATYTGMYSWCTAAYPSLSYQSLYTPFFLPYGSGCIGSPVLVPHQP